jgi:hypothetical protein
MVLQPWGVPAAGLPATTTEVGDVEGGPSEGCWRHGQQRSPPKLKTSMAGLLGGAGGMSDNYHHQSRRRRWRGPWGVLAAWSVAAITEVEDVDGKPPGGCWRHVQQRPPLKLETSMADPLGGAGGRAGSDHH